MVDKLLPSRKDTKRSLKHKKEEMPLQNLALNEHASKIHVIEDTESSQGHRGSKKRPKRTTTRRTTVDD